MKKILKLLKMIASNPRVAFDICKFAIMELYKNELTRLAMETGSDKGYPVHGYTRIYNHYLKERKNEIINILEVGLLAHATQNKLNIDQFNNAPSLYMWRKYFKNANLYGFDIKDFSKVSLENCTIIQGDQSSRRDLRKILENQNQFDIIIDDALHASKHQQITLSFLFPYLKPGGMYFIEDLNWQPDAHENTPKTLDLLKEFLCSGRWRSPEATPEECIIFERDIKSIVFFDSHSESSKGKSDALAVILKK